MKKQNKTIFDIYGIDWKDDAIGYILWRSAHDNLDRPVEEKITDEFLKFRSIRNFNVDE